MATLANTSPAVKGSQVSAFGLEVGYEKGGLHFFSCEWVLVPVHIGDKSKRSKQLACTEVSL